MKNLVIIIFILANLSLFSQTTYVPDDNFEQALINLGLDDVLDDYVLSSNITGITYLDVGAKNISDLTGIQDFTALTQLYCTNNELTSLNVSANSLLTKLRCGSNQLSSLNISANPLLQDLFCDNNQLTNLDVSANPFLQDLFCDNNQLTSLDLSANVSLAYLYCSLNQLNSLDIRNGNNANISNLSTFSNPDLTCIFVDDATWSTTNWTSIDPNSTFVETEAECDAIQTTYVPDDNFEQALIDLGYDDVLDDYVLSSNISVLTSLDVSNQGINDLTGIDEFVALTYLFCQENSLTSLDVSANLALIELYCYENLLTSLNISANTALTKLFCSFNELTSLDVTANMGLTYLYCSYNNITELDVSGNQALIQLYCSNNQLPSLDVSANSSIVFLECSSNYLFSFDVRNGNNTDISYIDATDNPELNCIYVDDAAWSTTNWTNIDPSSTFVETEAECNGLDVKDISNNGLIIYPNPTKEMFRIKTKNKIKNITVYDVFGKIIFKKTAVNQNESIDLSCFVAGAYFVRVQTDNKTVISKIVKW